jgi:HPt (histidine-containing phosphotransfer) domain-containing protein
MEFKYINPEYLDSVANGDIQLIEELVDMFSSQVVEIYGEMKNLLAAGNYKLLGLLAHKAKSSVAIMGMNDLASLLKTFELQAKQGESVGSYSGYIEKFHIDSAIAVTELKELVKMRSGR